MGMKRLQGAKHSCVILRLNGGFIGEPFERIAISDLFKQLLKGLKISLAHLRQFGIGKLAKQNVHLSHAPMMGAKQDSPPTWVKISAGNLRTGHGHSRPNQ